MKPNHGFYLAATFIGGNAWEPAVHIWDEALKASTEKTEFQEFADTTHQAAGRLYGAGSAPQQAVRVAWKEVGIPVTTAAPAADKRERGAAAGEPDSQAALVAGIDRLAAQAAAPEDNFQKSGPPV